MSQELMYLFGSIVILIGLLVAQAANTVVHNGMGYAVGPRDEAARENVFSGRVKRTISNHIEGLVLFGFAILIIETADLENSVTKMGAALYFWSRLAYAPIYLLGISVIRTIVWSVGLFGTLMVLYVCATGAL
ncbi:MAPEG family protein [Henriciella sp. AS95]|uniref:MAPEG family protein n=1 Tax=Henriciella sp. AS95 TaxID=3135782 RepID=UPI00316E43F2